MEAVIPSCQISTTVHTNCLFQFERCTLSVHLYYVHKIQHRVAQHSYLLINALTWGAQEVICGPEGAPLADNRVLIKLRKCHLFIPSPTHACPCHGTWATS